MGKNLKKEVMLELTVETAVNSSRSNKYLLVMCKKKRSWIDMSRYLHFISTGRK